MQNKIKAEAENLATHVEADLRSRLPSLQRIARRWETRGGMPKEEFTSDALNYLSDTPGFQALTWVDEDLFVRWIVPLEGNEQAQDLNLAFEQNRRGALEKAKTTRLPTMTDPIELAPGGKGFLICFPIYVRGEFEGIILAVFRVKEWLDYVFKINKYDISENFRISVFFDDVLVFKEPGWDQLAISGLSSLADAKILDHRLSIHIRPTHTYIEQNKTLLPELVAISCGLLSVLVAFIAYLLQKSFIEAWASHAAKAALEVEIRDHAKTENELQYALTRLDMATKAGGIGVWTWDVSTDILTWNERMYNLYDIPADVTPTYETWRNALHPDDRAATESLLKFAVIGKAVFNTEFRIVRANGEVYYLGTAGKVERDHTGKPLRMTGINWDITDRKYAEQALKESEEKFRGLSQSSPTAIMLYQNNRWVYANPAAETITGYTAQELLTMNYWEVVHPDYRHLVQERGQKRQKGAGVIPRYEIKIIAKDGRVKWVDVTGSTTMLGGSPAGIISVIDITLRKTAEEALKQSEEQVRLLLNSTAEAIYGIDLQGNCTFANPSCLRTLGYVNMEQLLGKNMHHLIHYSYPDGHPMLIEDCKIFQAVCEGKLVHVDDEVLWKADGASFHVEYWSYPQIVSGKVSGAVVTFIDITERRKAEEALRDSRQKFQALVETLYDWIWEVDPQGHYTYVSPQIKNILGYEPREILGKTPYDLMSPDEAKRVSEIFAALLKDGKPIVALENINSHKDGRLVVLETNGLPFYDADGNFKGYRGTDRDISERKQAQEALATERRRLSYILEGTNVGTWEWNVQTGEIIFNERWAEIIGYTLGEIVPVSIETWMKFIHPDDLKTSQELLEKHFNRELPYYECEARMLHKNGNWIWVLDRGKVATRTDDGKPLIMSGTHQEITQRKLAEEKIKHMANHDGLTGLPSLRLVKDRLSMSLGIARRHHAMAAVMFIDLDGFKVINDTLGHDAGDYVLIQVAQRLLSSVRETDTVARIGGDEFLYIATGLQTAENAALIAEKIIRIMSQPVIFNGQQTVVSASIGIALVPRDGEDAERLIKLADEAMYEVKNSGKNGYRFANTGK